MSRLSGRYEHWKETDHGLLDYFRDERSRKKSDGGCIGGYRLLLCGQYAASLIPRFVELFIDSSAKYKRVSFVVDVRGDNDFQKLFSTLEEIRLMGINCKVLFLDCSDEELINRHKAARRRHPLDENGQGLTFAVAENENCWKRLKTGRII